MFKDLFSKWSKITYTSHKPSIEELALKVVEQSKLENQSPEDWELTRQYKIESEIELARQLFMDEFGKDILDYLEKEGTGKNWYGEEYTGKWEYKFEHPYLKVVIGKPQLDTRCYNALAKVVRYKQIEIERDHKKLQWIITVNPKCVGAGKQIILKEDHLDLRNELLKIIGNLLKEPNNYKKNQL